MFRKPGILTIAMMVASVLQSQTISVGMPYFEDAYRRAQLMGLVDPSVSFCLRPLDVKKAFSLKPLYGKDTFLFPNDTFTYFNDKIQLPGKWSVQILPFHAEIQYNGHHPYGWQNGPLVSNKGAQFYFSGGVQVNNVWLDIKLQPEMVYAQNLYFMSPPHRVGYVDMPERMGQEAYQRFFGGQSHAKIRLGKISMGWGTENLFWGPGISSAIILSNNSPGFGHGTIHTNKPIKTKYGSLEFQAVGANTKFSGFYPYGTTPTTGVWPYRMATDIVYNEANAQAKKYFSGMNVVFQPKIFPGLFLGVNRVKAFDTLSSYWNYLDGVTSRFTAYSESFGNKITRNTNSLAAFFFRIVMPESHAEFYGEYGREDWAWDIQDIMTQPEYSRAWMGGFRKLYPLGENDHWYQYFVEFTTCSAPETHKSRNPGYSFYMHGLGGGWTNQGQIMGAGIGPGSDMQSIGVTFNKGFTQTQFKFERVAYFRDMLLYSMPAWAFTKNPNPMKVDDSKNWVDFGFMFLRQYTWNRWLVRYQVHVMKTYNWQWFYLQGGVLQGFRYPGLNPWSLNSNINFIYRF